MKENYKIKIADKNDQEFLNEMLYQSIFVEPDSPKPDRQIVDIPELSKYVANYGIGSFLLDEILKRTKKIQSISLSVQPNNPAMDLYFRFGFYECGKEGTSVIMRYDNKAI